MSIRRKLAIALVAVGCALIPLTSGQVHAQEQPPAQGIQVSPVLVDLNAEKSNTYNLKITVTNVTAGDLVLKQNINDFRAKDETGNPEVILDNKNLDPSFSFSSWVKPLPSLTLKPKESKVVNVELAVPANAEAGGHYGVVRFSGNPPGQENANVSIAASVGVLVLARVNGTISESLKLKEFFVEKNNKHANFSESGPLSIVERIENDGNVHVKPSGTVTVKNMFGQTVLSAPLNDTARNILPKSTRRLSESLNKKWLFGRYTAHFEANYGYSNRLISGTMSFWVIPYKLILLVLLLLVGLVFLFRFLMKRHNDKIVQKALDKQT